VRLRRRKSDILDFGFERRGIREGEIGKKVWGFLALFPWKGTPSSGGKREKGTAAYGVRTGC